MKKHTIISLLVVFLLMLMSQVICKATSDLGTAAASIDVAEDSFDNEDELSEDNIESKMAYNESDSTVLNGIEDDKVSNTTTSVDAPPINNQSSTDEQYVSTLDLEGDRLGAHYRPKGYGLGKRIKAIKPPVGASSFSQELNRKADYATPKQNEADLKGVKAETITSDIPEKSSGPSEDVASSYEIREESINSSSSFTRRADIGVNEEPLVNKEYYEFGHNHGFDNILDVDLDKHVMAPGHQGGVDASYIPETSSSSMGHKHGNAFGIESRRGISYVPVLYQRRNYSNEVVYEPVYPNHRFGFYVPTVYPQYVTRMKNYKSPSQSSNDPGRDTQSKYYQQVNV